MHGCARMFYLRGASTWSNRSDTEIKYKVVETFSKVRGFCLKVASFGQQLHLTIFKSGYIITETATTFAYVENRLSFKIKKTLLFREVPLGLYNTKTTPGSDQDEEPHSVLMVWVKPKR
jgi:hypothetical protein